MSSFLKSTEQVTRSGSEAAAAGAPADAPAAASPPTGVAAEESDPRTVLAEARAHLETALASEWRQLEEALLHRLATAEGRVKELEAENGDLRLAKAEADRRLAVLHDVKALLASF